MLKARQSIYTRWCFTCWSKEKAYYSASYGVFGPTSRSSTTMHSEVTKQNAVVIITLFQSDSGCRHRQPRDFTASAASTTALAAGSCLRAQCLAAENAREIDDLGWLADFLMGTFAIGMLDTTTIRAHLVQETVCMRRSGFSG